MTEIRVAGKQDLQGIIELVTEFAEEHPSRDCPRSADAFEEAYFGGHPVAEIVIAVRDNRVVGMLEWHMMFDMFWSIYHVCRNGFLSVARSADREYVCRSWRWSVTG